MGRGRPSRDYYRWWLNAEYMTHDSEYFRRRAAGARAAAHAKGEEYTTAVAGDLALAYAALARREATQLDEEQPAPIMELSGPEPA